MIVELLRTVRIYLMASRIIQIGPPNPLECNVGFSKLADMLL